MTVPERDLEQLAVAKLETVGYTYLNGAHFAPDSLFAERILIPPRNR